jgi:hypothetical protein
MYRNFPTDADLRAFLVKNNLVESDYAGDLRAPTLAVQDQWKLDTEFSPFLADPEPSERTFDAPGPRMPRHRTYTSLLMGGGSGSGGGTLLDLGAGVVGSPVSVVIDGRTLIENEDFVMLMKNAPAEDQPYTQIRFTSPVYSKPNGIVITALWGFCALPPAGKGIPALAWEGCLQGAAAMFFYALPNVPDLESISRAGISESFEIASTVTANQRGEALIKTYHSAAKRYRRGGE